jgi:putative hemolysin
VTTALLVLLLAALVAVRAAAAMAEAVLAAGPDLRRPTRLGDDVLASAARAAAHVASGAAYGVVATVAWRTAGRGWVPMAVALAAPLMLVLADLTPRGLAAETPKPRRRVLEPLLGGLAVLLAPVLAVERVLALVLGFGRRPPALPTLRRLGGWLVPRTAGPLEVSEAGLVARLARFAEKTARDVMVPHVDVCAVPDTASVGDAVAMIHQHGHSRLPVFHERLFNIMGLVAHRDLLGVTDLGLPVTDVIRDVLFVPESKPLPDLFRTLQAEGRNLAVVVDEYGGAVGLVTVEDLVEEIVGEIEDEYDAPRELVRRVSSGVYLVNARAPVSQVNERYGWNLPQGEYETVGGLVLERLGRIPKPGDTVRAGRVRLEVTRAGTRAVQELRVSEGRW